MTLFGQLRIYILLRRIAHSLARMADSAEQQANLAQQEWDAQHAPRVPKPTEFGTLDLVEVNKRYHAEQVERGEVEP